MDPVHAPSRASRSSLPSALGVDAPRSSPADETGRWLLWMTGAAALALGAVALLLWGTRSGSYLFDLVAAFCA